MTAIPREMQTTRLRHGRTTPGRHGRIDMRNPVGRVRHLRREIKLKTRLILAAVLVLLGACGSMSTRTAGDAALCGAEATDQVERAAKREFCR